MRPDASSTILRARPARLRARVAASAVAALVVTPLVVLGDSIPSFAADELCLPNSLSYPNLGSHPITQYDDQVTLYVGGDFTVAGGSTEAEGLVVVGGDAYFGMDDWYNLGVAGVGSRVPPSPMSTMLRVGGTLHITNGVLEVGHGIGGGVAIGGGLVAPSPASLQTNGGVVAEHAADALADYAAWPANFQSLSAAYAALADTAGYDTADGLTITGDGSTSQQVITIPGDQLGTMESPSWLRLLDIPLGTRLIVNVTGATAELSMVSTFLGTSMSQVDPMATDDTVFAELTRSILWNFVDASDITLGMESQLPGSILVPNASSITKVMTSTNGRVYVAGDLIQGGPGVSGLEFHAYPFDCGLPPATGSFSVTKQLVNADAVTGLPADYAVEYSIDGGSSWTQLPVAAGATETVSGLPADTVVQLRELAPAAVAGASWASPAWTSESVTIVAGDVVAATVTNVITEDEEPPPSFATEAWVDDDGITKILPVTGGLVVDRIWYEHLTPGLEYRFDGWLMLDDGASGIPLGVDSSVVFTPASADGMLLMEWPISAELAAANEGERIVIFLELYLLGDSIPIAVDMDINSPTEWFTIEAGEVLSTTGGELLGTLITGTGLLALGLGLLLPLRRRRLL